MKPLQTFFGISSSLWGALHREKCILRNPVDLQEIMLHWILSSVSVEDCLSSKSKFFKVDREFVVWCSLKINLYWLFSKQTVSLFSTLYSAAGNRNPIENLIRKLKRKLWNKHFERRQNLKQLFCNASFFQKQLPNVPDFESTNLLSVNLKCFFFKIFSSRKNICIQKIKL